MTVGTVSYYTGPLEKDQKCPISWDPIQNPVRTSCGHLFSKEHLLEWIVTYGYRYCPTCKLSLDPAGILKIREYNFLRYKILRKWEQINANYEALTAEPWCQKIMIVVCIAGIISPWIHLPFCTDSAILKP